MLKKYYKKLEITNQVVLLITVVLIVGLFVKINMNVFLIPNNAQNISLNTPFLAYILIVVLFSTGLIALIIFIKKRQINDEEDKNVGKKS